MTFAVRFVLMVKIVLSPHGTARIPAALQRFMALCNVNVEGGA